MRCGECSCPRDLPFSLPANSGSIERWERTTDHGYGWRRSGSMKVAGPASTNGPANEGHTQ